MPVIQKRRYYRKHPSAGSMLTFGSIFGYSVGNFGISLAWSFLSAFLLYYYTDIAGISAAAATMLVLTARIWDAANDPVVGVLADKTKSPWGRYRPWLLLGSIPFGLLFALTLTVPQDLPASGKLAYIYATYFLLVLAFTVVQIPLTALMGVMTPHEESRSVLASTRSVLMVLCSLVAGVAGLPLITFLGKGSLAAGFQSIGIYIGGIGAFSLWIAFFCTRETLSAPVGQKITLKKVAQTIFFNGPLLAILIGQLIGGFVLYGRISSSIYYFQYFAGNVSLFQTYSLIFFSSMMCGAYYAPAMSRIWGKRCLVCLTSFFGGLTMLLTYNIHPAHLFTFLLFTALSGILQGCRMSVLFAMIPETVEYGQRRTGIRADGVVSSTFGLIMKLGTALGSIGVGYMMSRLGYIPGAVQPAAVLNGFNLMMHTIPGIGIMLTTIPFLFTRLDESHVPSVPILR